MKFAHSLFDIEADQLEVHDVTTVHSLVIQCYKTRRVLSCNDHDASAPSIADGLDVLARAETITAHNGIGYDVPVLRNLYDWDPQGRILDTLVMSKTLFAHRKEADYDLVRKRSEFPKKMIGRHSLESWGYRLGLRKIEYEGPWDEWSPTMQTYCEGDVRLLDLIMRRFRRYKRYVQVAVAVEHDLAQELYWGKRAGVPVDVPAGQELYAVLAGEKETTAREMRKLFDNWLAPKPRSAVCTEGELRWLAKMPYERAVAGLATNTKRFFFPKRDNKRYGYIAGAPCSQLELVEFNPTSRDHIAKVLIDKYDWKPEVFTDEGKPTVSEVTMKGLKYTEVPKIMRMLMLQKRIGALATGAQAWLKLVDEYDVLHPHIHHNHAVTHRGGHARPNITQAPKVKNPFGKEFRALLGPPKGWNQLGVDVTGLELRCLAHELAPYDGGQYAEWVLSGNVHEMHQEMMGNQLDYDDQKTWFYAYLYGAGDEKLGRIGRPDLSPEQHKALGKKRKKIFEGKLRALAQLQKKLAGQVATGFIELIDGRHAMVRSEHAALNTLLQGTGALLCKYWIVDTCEWMRHTYGPSIGEHIVGPVDPWTWHKYGDWSLGIWAHDETQTYLYKSLDAEAIGAKSIEFIAAQQERFGFRCPLTGDAKVGRNWADCH